MLHKNVVEKSGFRTLETKELETVSGGQFQEPNEFWHHDDNDFFDEPWLLDGAAENIIVVTASRDGSGGGIVGSIDDALNQYHEDELRHALSLLPDETFQIEGQILVIADGGEHDALNVIPVPPFILPDGNEQDFEEFLVNETDMTSQEYDKQIVVHTSVGNQDAVIHFNGYGEGAIYLVNDNLFSDDQFTLFTTISNAKFTPSESDSATITSSGGSIGVGSGFSITYDNAGPAG